MRLSGKKVILVSGLCLLVWMVLAFTSLVEVPSALVPRGERNLEDLEARILKVEEQVDVQLAESNSLLLKLKKQLKSKEEKIEDDNSFQRETELEPPVIPVLVIACNRVTVQRCLQNLIEFRPSKATFPIIVSQDCAHNETYEVIRSFVSADSAVTVVQQPDQAELALPRSKLKFRGYYNIARHYKFALHHIFQTLNYQSVIIVEDDLDISPDFFEYFLGTYPLLKKDPSLWCISAWNDNGKKALIDRSHPDLLHRTDFFPGLGWMLLRDSWLSLEPRWPEAFFDDWLRSPEQTASRSCIRPEISRTSTFGKVGVSKGLFFDMHLRYIQLNGEFVPFTKIDLTYLTKEPYDAELAFTVGSVKTVSLGQLSSLPQLTEGEAVKVLYASMAQFQRAARTLGLMDDFRSGIPRTAYRGVVQCFHKGRRVYIVPDFVWEKYDPSWG